MGNRKEFTPAEIEILQKNPYTKRITQKSISYTLAFKKAFWELSLNGYSGTAAFRELGYDVNILGFERIHNTTKRIRRAAQTPGGLQERRHGVRIHKGDLESADLTRLSQQETTKRLQHEIVYLQQQMAFLKKVTQPARPRERGKS